MLRLPSDLHRRLVQQAERDGRSLNQELVRRIEASFRNERIESQIKRGGVLADAYREMRETMRAEMDEARSVLEQIKEAARNVENAVQKADSKIEELGGKK